jgi:hypothetical protein
VRRRLSGRFVKAKLASTPEVTPGELFEEIMLTKYFCGTTSSLNPALHCKTKIRALLVSKGARFSEELVGTILQFWFGGNASSFSVCLVREGVFEFQTASADVAAEITLGGKWKLGPICMQFELVNDTEAVGTLHACHDRPERDNEGTAVNHQAKFHSSTCSDSTQLPVRRDNSGQCCTAIPFQYAPESSSPELGRKTDYTASDTHIRANFTSTPAVETPFLPLEVIMAPQRGCPRSPRCTRAEATPSLGEHKSGADACRRHRNNASDY